MTDTGPRIDDRTFQDLVDEAKRMIPLLCPEWTNHGPADPGIALLEVFAWMTDLLLQRVNALGDRAHESFVEFLGVRPMPAAAATVDVVFLTDDALEAAVVVPRGTEVGTFVGAVSGDGARTAFETVDELRIVPPRLVAFGTTNAAGELVDRSDELQRGAPVTCFPSTTPGETLVVGLAEACEGAVLSIDVACSVLGLGVDPADPPLAWEVSNGDAWEPVDEVSDGTGGLQRDGKVTLTVTSRHTAQRIGGQVAHWIRCRLVDPDARQTTYSASPTITHLEVHAAGGVVTASHGSTKPQELLGISDGTPGQVFRTSQCPVLARRAHERIVVSAYGESSEWSEVEDFSRSGPDDPHYTFDSSSGVVRFGPSVAQADGRSRQFGAVVPVGADVTMTSYRVGGGRIGNVGAFTLTNLLSTVPHIVRVQNTRPASGGVDAETRDEWRNRARLWLQTGQRAVTRDDYERIAVAAHPNVARAVCTEAASPHHVEVGIVPRTWSEVPVLDDLAPTDEVRRAVCDAIELRRTVGTSVTVGAPHYLGVRVVARVRSKEHDRLRLEARCVAALATFLHPLTGGVGGFGWPFGRDVDAFGLAAVLGALPDVDVVEDLRLFEANARTGDPEGDATNRVTIAPGSLPLLVRPTVLVTRGVKETPMAQRLVDLLPPSLAEDDFTNGFVSILDHVRSSVVGKIDGASHYFDPTVAPVEFVRMLAGWLNLHVPSWWTEDEARGFVLDVVPLIQWRGTRRWLEAFLSASAGCEVRVEDPHHVNDERGQATEPDGAPVVVRIVGERGLLTRADIESLVRAEMPAGVPYEVRFEPASTPDPPRRAFS